MQTLRTLIACFLLLVFSGCGSRSSDGYSIGIDPSFFPLNIEGREENVYVFLHDLFHAIGKEEGISFSKVNVAWDMLLGQLDDEKYDAAVSPLRPFVFNRSKYDFSAPLLKTGPVLVVREGSNVKTLADISERILYVENMDQRQMVMESHPAIVIQSYDQVSAAFERVLSGYAEGLLLESIDAVAYVNDLYAGRLRIAEGPYGDAALRVITKKKEHEWLLKAIDRGLQTVRDNGTYDALAQKWQLNVSVR